MNRRHAVLVALSLAVLVAVVYAPVRHFEFVQLDDPAYVTENPQVLGGLTLQGGAWAFTTGHAANWHPITWLSHMLDIQLFGTTPGPHHVTNVLLHIASTLLLFGLLAWLTGAMWRSALVAALFGVHPLHVESVAWVAERKDVLSTLFWLLTMCAYVAYVRASPVAAPSARPGRRTLFYALTLVLFAIGLMAKPMLVTLPFVLLLTDVWPLARTGQAGAGIAAADVDSRSPRSARASSRPSARSPKRARKAQRATGRAPVGKHGTPDWRRVAWSLVREKLPLVAMAAASSAVTVLVQQRGGAVSALDDNPLGLRIQNALVSLVAYLRDTLWPARLTVIYPFPDAIPLWQSAGACVALCAISFAVYRLARRHPYLAVGWLWYLGTLVPVAGLVRVGLQARADRYTYVPLIGIFIMIAWGAAALAARVRPLRLAIPVMAAIAVAGCAVAAREQIGYWKDNVSLFTRATVLTLHVDEYEAHMSLGATLANQGRMDEALRHFTEAVRLRPQAEAARRAMDAARRGGLEQAPR
jgi:hypothetical protein